ncbi:hypothetical protein RI129_012073 [Pyrocoelia pectoralis]|uniref:Phosphoglycerate mutase n=1 Tax=Pyrocoelia pectoralis TaxID=417401 RepID=A0AAN7V623_9COLE
MVNYKIVMVRHGESEWNQKNLFCGWFDSNLSEKGREEALSAGKALKDANYKFDVAYTSVLTRAQDTLKLILEQMDQTDIPVNRTWRLNERHYGSLTGHNKAKIAAKYGEEQVIIWRRSFIALPPPMSLQHRYCSQIVDDPRYKDGPSKEEFPFTESLEGTMKRTLPFWYDVIVPQIKAGKSILIVAHGNSLRVIQIMSLNFPTGMPFVYTLGENLKPIPNGSLQFLEDSEIVKKAMDAVAAEGKTK